MSRKGALKIFIDREHAMDVSEKENMDMGRSIPTHVTPVMIITRNGPLPDKYSLMQLYYCAVLCVQKQLRLIALITKCFHDFRCFV